MKESRKLCRDLSDAELRRMQPIWHEQARKAHSLSYEAQREISRRDRESKRAAEAKQA